NSIWSNGNPTRIRKDSFLYSKTSSGYPTHDCTSNDCAACPDELPDFYDRQAAQVEWTALAPLISHSPAIRVSRDGGKTYPHKWVREFHSDGLLPMPAAVHVHDGHGCGHVIVLALDRAAGTVADDYTALAQRLDANGALWFADASPSGGRHIYLPLNDAIAHTALADAARRLSSLYPSIDPSPHHSADTGCIRPPGSVWKRGGHQRLITHLKEAIAAATLRHPNTPLRALITGTPAHPLPSADDRVAVGVTPYLPAAGPQASPRTASTARTALHDSSRSSTPPAARQAATRASARAGLGPGGAMRRLEPGTWPGRAAMYRRYG